ncbi:MAG: hypothetical protein ACRESZ_11295 [Methylococcales bacterium]
MIQPLEKLLTEIKKITGLLPEKSGDKLNDVVIRPAKQKLHAISKSGKQASIKRIKNTGNWIVGTVTRGSEPATAT